MTDDVRNLDDTATQRLPRPVTPPWPGPLDQTRSAPEPPPVPETDVLSIDELMEPAPETAAAETVAPETETFEPVEFEPVEFETVQFEAGPTVLEPAPATPTSAVPEPAPAATSAPAAPASAPASPRPNPTADVLRRLRADGGAALSGARRHTSTWLGAEDHGLVVATALATLLLLIVVAVFG